MNSYLSIFGLPYIESAFVLSVIAGAALYLLTWFVTPKKKTARVQIAGPILAMLLLHPWWSAFAGALLGHFLMVMLIDKILKKQPYKPASVIMTIALLFQVLTSGITTSNAQKEINAIVKEDANSTFRSSNNQEKIDHILSQFQPVASTSN